ncbi:MAG: SDR family NAD(P)-dependent oxidoreductase [Bacteroidia bacterium]|nr:SDR family NAD(P)-dependent oxidoreductase [Bacteroidia bacterium]
MPEGRFKNPFVAALTGMRELFAKQALEGHLHETDRLDGKTAMVTGSSSGLGFAIAVDLARRGARVIMAVRSGIPAKGEEVKRLSGSNLVEMRPLDLADFDTIKALCEGLQHDGIRLDVMVSNAGVFPPSARQTKYGLDESFQVNFLGKFLLLNRLLEAGIIPNTTFAHNKSGDFIPRIVIVSSESHQGASAIDWDKFGQFADYGVKDSISVYGYNKLLLTTFATELSRRLNPDPTHLDVSVNALCPGAVNTNIARDAPKWLMPVLKLSFSIFFNSPEKAARPISYLAASPEVEGKTNYYLHMFNEKSMDPKCYDLEAGKMLWERSKALLGTIIH